MADHPLDQFKNIDEAFDSLERLDGSDEAASRAGIRQNFLRSDVKTREEFILAMERMATKNVPLGGNPTRANAKAFQIGRELRDLNRRLVRIGK